MMNKGWEGGLLMLEMSGEWYFLSWNSRRQRKLRKLSGIFLFNQSLTGSLQLECKESVLSMLSVRFMHLNIMTPTRLGVSFFFSGGNRWTYMYVLNSFYITTAKLETPNITAIKSVIIIIVIQHSVNEHGGWMAVG